MMAAMTGWATRDPAHCHLAPRGAAPNGSGPLLPHLLSNALARRGIETDEERCDRRKYK
jgi:hypothetical protein